MGFTSEQKAEAHNAKVLGILDPECEGTWKGRVWYNHGGWHVCWQWGSVTLYYEPRGEYYHTLVGAPNGAGGHMDLSQGGGGRSQDPKEAIRLACDTALEVIENEWKSIELSVSVVRLSLGAE